MATLVVHLVNSAGLSAAVRDTIRDRVTYLLNETIRRADDLGVGTGGITEVDVRWVQHCPQGHTRRDVVIRFRSRAQDGEQYVCHATPQGWEFASRGRTTFDGEATRSRVHVPQCTGGATPQGNILGNIAFHELMHNKLHMEEEELHGQYGVLLGSGGDLGPALEPSDGDVRLLAPHLGDQHTQLCP
ncbi:MAG: hypothetical protein L0Z62_12310 [Gemmataceae bacterium]|nr:hypothetical protein [Gemmataceae bacterium]